MGSKNRVRISPSWLASLALLIATEATAGYSIVNLGSQAIGSSSIGKSINASGGVAGTTTQGSGTSAQQSMAGGGFTGVSMSPLTYAGSSVATGINDGGQVTGSFYDVLDKSYHAFVSSNGVTTDLGTINKSASVKGISTQSQAINASGQVTGTVQFSDGTSQAFRGSASGGLALLPSIGTGQFSQGNGINSGGQVVGTFQQATGVYHAFYTDAKNTPVDITTKYSMAGFGVNSYGMAINASGAVVGYGDFGLNNSHAFLAPALGSSQGTSKTPVIDLGVLAGYTSSRAYGINSTSQVVGEVDSGNSNPAAFVWDASVGMIDLRSLLSPADQLNWTSLTIATSINDNLQITGQGIYDGQLDAFELTPIEGEGVFSPASSVPAPPALVLTALGSALAAAWTRIRPRIRKTLA